MPKLSRFPSKGQRSVPEIKKLGGKWHQAEIIQSHSQKFTRRVVLRPNESKGAKIARRRDYISIFPPNVKVEAAKDIVLYLQRNGVFVPRIHSIDQGNNLLHFGSGGFTIYQRMMKMAARHIKKARGEGRHLPLKTAFEIITSNKVESREIRGWLFKAFRMIGRVHALGVSHGHPHPKNIVVQGNKVGLIDFKQAKVVPNSIWAEPEKIKRKFHEDYLKLALTSDLFFQKGKKRLFSALVARYPCSQAVKEQLLRLISSEFKF